MQRPARQLCLVQPKPGPTINDSIEEPAGVRVVKEIARAGKVALDDAQDLGGELVKDSDKDGVCGGCF